MPLRLRLIALIGIVLLVSVAGGSALVAWHAASSVRTELRAALEVGAQSVRNGIEELPRAGNDISELQHLVSTFNGNRHVRAELRDPGGHTVATSQLLSPAQPVPNWFRHLIGGRQDPVRLAVPEPAVVIVLRADPTNEIGEVWAESRDAVVVLAGFAALSAALSCLVLGRALRPLENFARAFDQIGTGDYRSSIPERGPPELSRLARGFNTMTNRLAAASAQNRRLNERMLTLQAEERADLARDLHDEIGPVLFAVEMTAATIEQLARTDRFGGIPEHVHSIHDAVGQIQRHVRLLLGRLRPLQAITLAGAIDRLTTFWRLRRPDIVLTAVVTVDEERLADDLKETIYRIVQEAISNAIRHGKPSRIAVTVGQDGQDGMCIEVVDDGSGMTTEGAAARHPSQLGLIGMRERVMAMAGSLSMQAGRGGKGVALVAWLPAVTLHSQDMDEPE